MQDFLGWSLASLTDGGESCPLFGGQSDFVSSFRAHFLPSRYRSIPTILEMSRHYALFGSTINFYTSFLGTDAPAIGSENTTNNVSFLLVQLDSYF